MELRQYTAILWRWKWLIVLGTVLATVSAFVASRMMTPVYEASTTLLINEAPDAQTSDYTALLMSERLARTYAQMLTQNPVLEETAARVEFKGDMDALEGAINVQMVRDTQLIQVSVEHVSSFMAAELANTLVAVFSEQNEALQMSRFAASKANLEAQLKRLDEQIEGVEVAIEEIGGTPAGNEKAKLERLQADLASYQTSYTSLLESYEGLRREEARSTSNVIQIEPATRPEDPVRPRTMLNTLLAAVVGGMISLGVVFLIEYLDDTVKTLDEVEQALGLPVIGTIAHIKTPEGGLPYVSTNPRAPATEAFRSLRTNIRFASVDRAIETLLITSPGPDEGKTTVSVNLAAVMAQGGKQTLLLDADLRRPSVHKILDLPNRIGLSDLFVRNPFNLDGAVKDCGVPELVTVTSGELPPNPSELLGSERMGQILSRLKEDADVVVIDTSPIMAVTDPVVLAAQVDGVLLVIEPGKTQIGAAVQAVEALRHAGANLIGVIFNNVPLQKLGYYYGGYRYQYMYSYDSGDGIEQEQG